jgi:hypothetical protein
MGALANITGEGFAPSAFHAYPSTLAIDGYSGDYGPGFFGHAVTAGTYVTRDPEFGWLAFGGNVTVDRAAVRVEPLDADRSRIYVAPLGLWLTLDAGKFAELGIAGDVVRLFLAPASPYTRRALLRIEQPARVDGVGPIAPAGRYATERGAYVIPLSDEPTEVFLRTKP